MSLESDIQDTFSDSHGWPDVLSPAGRLAVAACPAVYAITTTQSFGRLRGSSDILYVGQTGLLGGSTDRARLWAYSYSRAARDRRIRTICADLIPHGHVLTLRWRAVASVIEAQSLEAALFAQSYSEHSELPPLNHSAPRLQ